MSTTSSPVERIATRGRRANSDRIVPHLRRQRHLRVTQAQSRRQQFPARRALRCRAARCSAPASPRARASRGRRSMRAYSIITTASAPCGTAAPVMISTHSPAPTVRIESRCRP